MTRPPFCKTCICSTWDCLWMYGPSQALLFWRSFFEGRKTRLKANPWREEPRVKPIEHKTGSTAINHQASETIHQTPAKTPKQSNTPKQKNQPHPKTSVCCFQRGKFFPNSWKLWGLSQTRPWGTLGQSSSKVPRGSEVPSRGSK